MGRFLTADDFIAQFGADEASLIAGTGAFNSLEGSQIDRALIEREIAFTDDIIGGYVLPRHEWLTAVAVGDMPDLLKGLGGDIVRYRLRDLTSSQGQITETVEVRYRDAMKALKDIAAGRLDVIRDRRNGAPLGVAEIPATNDDLPAITGQAPQSASQLKGY